MIMIAINEEQQRDAIVEKTKNKKQKNDMQ